MLKFRLKEFMNESGLSIQAVSDKTGISRTTISALYNHNNHGIQFDTLDKLTNKLGIEVWDLFENDFPKEDLRYSLRQISDDPLDEDDPSFEAVFFYEQNKEADITISEFKMPLLVQIDTINKLQSMSVFLSYEITGDGWQSNANENKLKDFLTHSNGSELEPFFMLITAEIYRIVSKTNKFSSSSITVFKSDVGDFPADAGEFPIIYSWPVSYMTSDELCDSFLQLKYHH